MRGLRMDASIHLRLGVNVGAGVALDLQLRTVITTGGAGSAVPAGRAIVSSALTQS